MNLIERVAQLLGPIPQPKSKSSVPDGEGVISDPDLIERAVDGSYGRSGFAEARPTRPASRTTLALRVDLDRLRRQNIITPDGQRTPTAESFRRIKRQILKNAANSRTDVPTNLVLVTSALAGEGKTFCAINLAISVALEMDHTVLLVDADVAKPSVPRALGFETEKGLMDVLRDRGIDMADVLCKTNIEKLMLLPAGRPHARATELLASDAMRELLREMAKRYRDRIIVFDSPPLLAASEAAVLASQAGQVIMVVEAGKTTESALTEALGRIDPSHLTGLVLNKGESSSLGYGYDGYG